MRLLGALSLLGLFALPASAEDYATQREAVLRRLAKLPLELHFDQPYASNDNIRQMVDLYLPKKRNSDKPLPVVVYIHGGGWINGTRLAPAVAMSRVAGSGDYAGVSVGYRVSNEAKWPAQIYDCKAAIRWIRGHAKEYNLDPDHIAVWGSSAGGQLASLLGTSGDVKELEGDLGEFKNLSSRVTCVVNFCGPQDMVNPMLKKNGVIVAEDSVVTELFGGSIKDKHDLAVSASPLTHVTSDDPPFLTAHGDHDLRVDYANAEKLDAALKKVGVPHILLKIVNGGHGFRSPELDKRIDAFFALHLRGVKSEISAEPILDESPPKK